VKGTIGGWKNHPRSEEYRIGCPPSVNVIVNVPSPTPVAKLGKTWSLQMTPPMGVSEPVALPISGGFSGSPLPDPLRAYVTLIVSACGCCCAEGKCQGTSHGW